MKRRTGAWLAVTLLATGTLVGCGQETPRQDELVQPSEREAVPFDEEAAEEPDERTPPAP